MNDIVPRCISAVISRERNCILKYLVCEYQTFRNSPFWIGDGAEGPGSAPEVGTLDPVGLVLEIVTRQTPRVGRIRLTVHNLQGASGVRGVTEVLIAGHASHAGGENRGPRGGAR